MCKACCVVLEIGVWLYLLLPPHFKDPIFSESHLKTRNGLTQAKIRDRRLLKRILHFASDFSVGLKMGTSLEVF